MKLDVQVQYFIATLFLSFLCANIRLAFSQSKETRLKQVWPSILCFLLAGVMDWFFVIVFEVWIGWCVVLSIGMGLFLYYGSQLATKEAEQQSDIWGFISMLKRGYDLAKEERNNLKQKKDE